MNSKILILSLFLPLSTFAVDNIKESSTNNFIIDFSNLEKFDFKNTEPNVFVHEDSQKTIQIITGKQGLIRYISDLENQLNNIDLSLNDFYENEFKYQNIINRINLFESKLNNLKLDKGQSNIEFNQKSITSASLCQIGFSQAYNFGAVGWFNRYFEVTSSYPSPAGPYPPVQLVNITANSSMTIDQPTGPTLYPFSSNSSTGTNNHAESVSARSTFNLRFVEGGSQVSWNAGSIISKGSCFGYILSNGTI